MFERFTDRARRVVVLAQKEARMLNHDHIGTEHLLLGLIHEEEGNAARALTEMGIGLAAARAQVEEILGRGEANTDAPIPFTPRAKKVLELSLRESRHLGHNDIGTEHILLGLVREGEGVGAQVLAALKVDLSQVRAHIRLVMQRHLEHPGDLERPGAAAEPAGAHASRLSTIEERLVAVEERLEAIERRLESS